MTRSLLLRACIAAFACTLTAQSPASAQPAPTDTEVAIAAAAAQGGGPAGPPATLTYANRPIVVFRSSLLGRGPEERAAAARSALDQLADQGVLGPVTTRQVGDVVVVDVGGRYVIAITQSDTDLLAGETLTATGALAASRLQVALDEVAAASRPRELLIGLLLGVLATLAFAAFIWALTQARAGAGRRLGAAATQRLSASRVGDEEFVRSSRIIESLDRLIKVSAWTLFLFVGYFWLTFTLRRFPYTRPWGEALRSFLLERLSHAGFAMLNALPALFSVLLIALITRAVGRTVQYFFHAVEEGRIQVPWLYPETAEPTRKLVVVALWLFAVAIAYPYLPGSDSDAFKGVSVFAGLVISLGSSGVMNQMMSGFTLTYSRALQMGDFVRVGDVLGTVTEMGTLATKVRTPLGEEVTIPNAVVVSQIVTNYSKRSDAGDVFVPTEITIGYDTAWRQVHALLLLAAARTEGVRRAPAPSVTQASLEDPYVKYKLFVCLEDPATRLKTLGALHANILDAFNEYEVQITSPRYVLDPASPKVVPKDGWYPPPATPPGPPATS